jgi:hypothetical protein
MQQTTLEHSAPESSLVQVKRIEARGHSHQSHQNTGIMKNRTKSKSEWLQKYHTCHGHLDVR